MVSSCGDSASLSPHSYPSRPCQGVASGTRTRSGCRDDSHWHLPSCQSFKNPNPKAAASHYQTRRRRKLGCGCLKTQTGSSARARTQVSCLTHEPVGLRGKSAGQHCGLGTPRGALDTDMGWAPPRCPTVRVSIPWIALPRPQPTQLFNTDPSLWAPPKDENLSLTYLKG